MFIIRVQNLESAVKQLLHKHKNTPLDCNVEINNYINKNTDNVLCSSLISEIQISVIITFQY